MDMRSEKVKNILSDLKFHAQQRNVQYKGRALKEVRAFSKWENVSSSAVREELEDLARTVEPNGWDRSNFSIIGDQIVYRPARDKIEFIEKEIKSMRKELNNRMER